MNARFLARGTRFICRRRQNVVGFDYLPTRNVSVAMAFDRSFPQSLASPTSPTPSIVG